MLPPFAAWLKESGVSAVPEWTWSLQTVLKAHTASDGLGIYVSPGPIAAAQVSRGKIGRDIAFQVTFLAKAKPKGSGYSDEVADRVVLVRERFEQQLVEGREHANIVGSLWQPVAGYRFDSFESASAVEQPIIESLLVENAIYASFTVPLWSTD